MPERIQLSRAKGWKMPTNTVKVDRTTKWGNPWTAENSGRIDPVLRFACETAPLLDMSPLRGKNLACWCKPGASCHADVLLELANQPCNHVWLMAQYGATYHDLKCAKCGEIKRETWD